MASAWLAALWLVTGADAQKGGTAVYVPSAPPVTRIGPGITADTNAPWSPDPDLRHRMMTARRTELKKHMSDNADRLLHLTRELEADLQQHEPTPADAKRLDEIAKLAHAVREQMKQ